MRSATKNGRKATRIPAILMAFALALGMGFSATAATYYEGTAKSNVNLRVGPSSKATKVGTLNKGDEVTLVASVAKGVTVGDFTADMSFYKLSTGEYVAAQYILAGKPIDSSTVDGGDSADADATANEEGDSEDELVSDIDLDSDAADAEGDGGEYDGDLEEVDLNESDDSVDDAAVSDSDVPEEEPSSASESASSSAQGTVTADALKVRVSPSMSATVIKKLTKGSKVTVTQSIASGSTYGGSKVSGNWYKINTGGFVSASFVKVDTSSLSSGSSSASSSTQTTSYSVGTATSDTKMYSKPMTLATEQGTLKKGESQRISSSHRDGSTVSGMTVSGNWYKLSNGYYVQADTIKVSKKTESSSLASDTTLKAGDVAKTTTKLNERSGPGTSYSKKGSLAKGETVTIDEVVQSGASHDGKTVSGTWAKLSDGGYVSVGYLSFVSSGSGESESTDDAPTQAELDEAIPEE